MHELTICFVSNCPWAKHAPLAFQRAASLRPASPDTAEISSAGSTGLEM
jgi:hypothetical protein